MIIVMQHPADAGHVDHVTRTLHDMNLRAFVSHGPAQTLISAVGERDALQPERLEALPGVAEVRTISKKFKIVARGSAPAGTVVPVAGVPVGGEAVQVIAGPCSVETPEQMQEAAAVVAAGGVALMRGGAFKPRSSPYSFQGHGEAGLEMLAGAARGRGLGVVTELMDVRQLDVFLEHGVDAIQIGTRNMQNFDLLKEVGRTRLPVILKRGMSATISEWLMAAEYVAASGSHAIILCERGIRAFESPYRNVLDLNAIPFVKRETHLPVIVDPSHAAGLSWMVPTLSGAALAAGADGLLVEVHPQPAQAWCDGEQSLNPAEFHAAMARWRAIAEATGRSIAPPLPEAGRQRAAG